MKNKKLNNKGFSLVELIIVIAIMVILVAVIAPQYLKFVNNSRVSTDIQTASDLSTAIDVAIADNHSPFGSTSDTTVSTLTFTGMSIDSMPLSKLTSNNTSWKVTGNDDQGVNRITLTVDGNEYECYPDAETGTNPIAGDGGLKK